MTVMDVGDGDGVFSYVLDAEHGRVGSDCQQRGEEGAIDG